MCIDKFDDSRLKRLDLGPPYRALDCPTTSYDATLCSTEAYKCFEPALFIVGCNKAQGWFFHAEIATRSSARGVLMGQA